MGRWVHGEADDVLDLRAKAGSSERSKVRMRCGCRRWASHRRCTARKEMPTVSAIGSAGPVGRLAGRPRLVVQQAVHALFGVAPLSAPDRRPAHLGTARHFGNRQPVRRKSNDPGPLNVLVRAVALADHRRQPRAVFGPQDHANILCHGRKIAQPDALVYHSFVSVHYLPRFVAKYWLEKATESDAAAAVIVAAGAARGPDLRVPALRQQPRSLNAGENPSEDLRMELVAWVRKEIGPIASPDVIQWAPGLPKTRSGKIMRRILRKIAENGFGALGDTSTLADPTVVDDLIEHRASA